MSSCGHTCARCRVSRSANTFKRTKLRRRHTGAEVCVNRDQEVVLTMPRVERTTTRARRSAHQQTQSGTRFSLGVTPSAHSGVKEKRSKTHIETEPLFRSKVNQQMSLEPRATTPVSGEVRREPYEVGRYEHRSCSTCIGQLFQQDVSTFALLDGCIGVSVRIKPRNARTRCASENIAHSMRKGPAHRVFAR